MVGVQYLSKQNLVWEAESNARGWSAVNQKYMYCTFIVFNEPYVYGLQIWEVTTEAVKYLSTLHLIENMSKLCHY